VRGANWRSFALQTKDGGASEQRYRIVEDARSAIRTRSASPDELERALPRLPALTTKYATRSARFPPTAAVVSSRALIERIRREIGSIREKIVAHRYLAAIEAGDLT
jgi:membrane-bound lytic murein transglycosylase MltF